MPTDSPTLTLREQVALPIAAGIFAGPSGEAILEAEDGKALTQIARLAFSMADAFLRVSKEAA